MEEREEASLRVEVSVARRRRLQVRPQARGERCTGAKATCSATLRHVEGRRASPLDGDAVHEAQLRLAVALSPLRARLVPRGEADHREEGMAPAPLRAPAEARCRSVRLQ